MSERGKIRNKDYASTIRDFSGLRFGNITPTDIDGYIEYKDKAFIFIESKYNESKLPYGQELALVRLVDVCGLNRPTVLFICSYETLTAEGEIDFAQTKVVKRRYNLVWTSYFKKPFLSSEIERFLKWVNQTEARKLSV